jgi:hypothetical protein
LKLETNHVALPKRTVSISETVLIEKQNLRILERLSELQEAAIANPLPMAPNQDNAFKFSIRCVNGHPESLWIRDAFCKHGAKAAMVIFLFFACL